jgi:hypothetical protein
MANSLLVIHLIDNPIIVNHVSKSFRVDVVVATAGAAMAAISVVGTFAHNLAWTASLRGRVTDFSLMGCDWRWINGGATQTLGFPYLSGLMFTLIIWYSRCGCTTVMGLDAHFVKMWEQDILLLQCNGHFWRRTVMWSHKYLFSLFSYFNVISCE